MFPPPRTGAIPDFDAAFQPAQAVAAEGTSECHGTVVTADGSTLRVQCDRPLAKHIRLCDELLFLNRVGFQVRLHPEADL
jgi:hypothetical protein